MIDGLAIDYAAARIGARLAWRPDLRLWQRLHAARDLRALLEAARNAPVNYYLTGVPARATAAEIDAAFRAQWRARVAELTAWTPSAWRAAVAWTAHLIDLPAVALLWSGVRHAWMSHDPVLKPYAGALAGTAAGRAALLAGPLGPIGRALSAAATPAEGGALRAAAPSALPAALQGWRAHWRSLWPADATQRAALHALEAKVLVHRERFARLPPQEAGAAREALAAQALRRLRADPAQPVALFCWLLVLAIDLERLRAETVSRALPGASAPASALSASGAS